ncbi:MAG TPA: maleylpyruvate isomerase family mycothiol-dependent enzyme [Acidimicrobiales bacterium]|nr:maleylpyruvate isomerase family mycothiol-dependent enzyme [Acidimicrobiales bacterium]
MPNEPVVDLLDQIWRSMAEACGGLPEAAWDAPTDCPGWSVRDQLSHVIGTELMLVGEPSPPAVAPTPAHVHNPVGEMNEAWIAERRARPGNEVLDEFVAVTGRRVAELKADSEARFEKVGPSPIGEVPYRQFMWVRAFDSWIHEQDLRRALGRPGNRDGPAEELTLGRVADGMGFVVGRKVKPPEGTTVVWQITGPLARTVTVGVEGGRGVRLDEPPTAPTARLTLVAETFWRLGCGRIDPAGVLAAGSVDIDGDADVGRAVVGAMNFMF